MDQVTFDLQGIDKLYNKFKSLEAKGKTEVKNEFNASALKIQQDAKRVVVVDNGFLRNSIYLKEMGTNDKFVFTVGAKAKYAPYIEFGTGGLVSVPAGYDQLAAMFKGKGIRKINLRARPFLIPAFEQEKPKLIERLKKLLNA
jgi:HK97 gp10 family phage protein